MLQVALEPPVLRELQVSELRGQQVLPELQEQQEPTAQEPQVPPELLEWELQVQPVLRELLEQPVPTESVPPAQPVSAPQGPRE